MKANDSSRIVIAANNGDVGGGEVMLLALAEALTELGMPVTVVAPTSPSGVVDVARDRGFNTVALEASTRVEYLRALRKWDRSHREGLLWCNGLLPAVATAGHRNRLVHLHQRPKGKQRALAPIARWGSVSTLVPSADMATVVRGSSVLHNWTTDMSAGSLSKPVTNIGVPFRLGFLGRPSTGKGVDVLVRAMKILNRASPRQYELLIGGESRFVDDESRDTVESALTELGNLVTRTGWIEPGEFFQRIDCLVCPSVFPESFGLVAAESMSLRVPVVVSDAGALPEVVGAEHPWIARAGDADDLARVLHQAAQGDPAAVERAYQRWTSLFSPGAGKQRLRALLTSLGLSIVPERKLDHE